MARVTGVGKRRRSRRARQWPKRSLPMKSMIRCIEFSTCLLAFGVLLLLVFDATLHPHSREAVSIAMISSGCAFARVTYNSNFACGAGIDC